MNDSGGADNMEVEETWEESSVDYTCFRLRYNLQQDAGANETAIVEQIERYMSELSTSYQQRIDCFVLKNMVFSEKSASALRKLFRHCYASKISWEKFTLDTCVQNGGFRSVLADALEFGLFRSIDLLCQPGDLLDGIFPEIDELDKDTACVFRDAIIKASRKHAHRTPVENLVIRGYSVEPRSTLAFLCNGVGHIRKSSKILSSLVLDGLRIGHTYEESDMAVDVLAEALSHNRLLMDLKIVDVYPISDTQLARLIMSLVHHPRLSKLTLHSIPWHDETLKALGCLIASSQCKIESLDMSERTIYEEGERHLQPGLGKPNLHNLIHAVPSVRSALATLNLSDCDLDNNDFRLLMYNLWKMPQLARLDLSYNLISSFDLTTFFQPKVRSRPCRLRSLDMTGNPVFCEMNDSQRLHLANIMYSTLGLGNLGRLLDINATHHIEEYVETIHRTDRLESGLLSSDDVIYKLLHGPVFAARESVGTSYC